MRRYTLLILSIAAVVMLAACTGAAPTSTPTLTPTQEPTPTSTLTPTQEPTPTSGILGSLEVRVTAGQPDSRVSSALVTVQNIETNLSRDSAETGWQSIDTGPQQFDLAKLQATEEVLASAMLQPGLYQQVRLQISEAVLTILGNVRDAEVLAEKLVFSGEFEVEAGATTVLTLDFDAEGSLKFRPGIGPGLDPVVKLLTREGGQPLAQARTVAAVGLETGSGSPQGQEAPSGAVRVVVPNDINPQWMNFWVAQGAGYFEEEGLEVQVVVPPAPSAVAQFLVMGRADMAVMPSPILLSSIVQGQPLLVFANLQAKDPNVLVVHRDVMEKRGLSSEMPVPDRLNGLQGLKVGVGGPGGPSASLRVLFESFGMDADTDIEMVIVSGEPQDQAFANKDVDALFTHSPHLEKAVVDQGAGVLLSPMAEGVPQLSNLQSRLLATTQSYAEANPEVLAALTRAVYRAQQLIHSDLHAATQAVRASGMRFPGPEELKLIVAVYSLTVPQTPDVSVEGLEKELEFFPDRRNPPDLSGVDMSQHVDNRFARKAVTDKP